MSPASAVIPQGIYP
ncbi:hypothetical protein E2C01_087215 [Portunus trituberculatus]|uniref:Uncharacterized protein n=1 Tax=Portunus trituberculatus TaxID=210409 RepID=A0A5B7JCR2_PORTR|nr:hypothetical protein [Portunus trituberculatus]